MSKNTVSASATQVIVEPVDGVTPILELLDSAESTIAIKMFSFTHPALIAALIRARTRSVVVRVLLNPNRSGGTRANDETVRRLGESGLQVAWTNPKFAVTHEKSAVIDGRSALIATFNFCEKYFTMTRDYGLILHEPLVVHEILAGFEADWSRGHLELPDTSSLIWSNLNARSCMARFIDAAKRTLDVQHPKFSDAVILDRLLAAQARGVRVRVICGGRHGISPADMLDTFSSLRILQRSGVRIRKQAHLRLHAKLIVSDGTRALTGSMNIDRSAFDLRRELGIVLGERSAVETLQSRFNGDWGEASGYAPPDPVALHLHTEVDLLPDEGLDHE